MSHRGPEGATWTGVIEKFIFFTLEQMEAARVNDRRRTDFITPFELILIWGKYNVFKGCPNNQENLLN